MIAPRTALRVVLSILLVGFASLVVRCRAGATVAETPKELKAQEPSMPPKKPALKLDLLKGLKRRVLPNGLTVLVKEDRRLPIATVVTAYRVGSVHEEKGATGLAHFLEHMMFKGTHRLAKGEIDALTFEAGGLNNAYTHNDVTAYWFSVHSSELDRFLEVEADRMRNCLLDRREWESELKVVIEELNRSLDRPWGRLWHEIEPAVFKVSSYHHPVIGFREDLERMQYETMVRFYRDYYGPNNAVLVVVGDVDPSKVFARVEELFEKIEPVKQAVPPTMPEPAQEEDRRVDFETDQSLHRLGLAWRSDRVGTPTDIGLDLLTQILAAGPDSRLYKRLVVKDRTCTDVSAYNDARRHDGVYFVFAELMEKASPGEVESAILDEVQRLSQEPVTDRELRKAKNLLTSNFVYEKERQYNAADRVAWFEALGLPDYLDKYLARVEAVTKDELQGLCRKVFRKENRTAAVARAKGRRHARPIDLGASGDAEFGECFEFRLPNGLTLLVKPRRELPIVSVQAYCDAGPVHEPDEKAGVAALTGRLLDQGTDPPGGKARTAEEIAEIVAESGSELSTSATGISFRTLTPNIRLGFDLVRDMLVHPSLPADKVLEKRELQLSELRARADSPELRAQDLFYETVYAGHPLHRPSDGYPETVEKLTREDVVAHHRIHFRPENTIIAVAGDVDPVDVWREIGQRFLEWKPPAEERPALPGVTRQAEPKKVVEHRPTNQINYVFGHLSIDRNHPDYFALRVLEHIYCRSSGFVDRLSKTVRDEEGLAYEVWGFLTERADRLPGPFMVYIGTAAQNGSKPLDLALKILNDLRTDGPKPQEIERVRKYLVRNLPFAWQTTDQLAAYMIQMRRLNLGMDYPRRYVRAIQAVTREDLIHVAQTYLIPESLTTVIVGPVEPEGKTK